MAYLVDGAVARPIVLLTCNCLLTYSGSVPKDIEPPCFTQDGSGYVLARANQKDGDVLVSAPIWLSP